MAFDLNQVSEILELLIIHFFKDKMIRFIV